MSLLNLGLSGLRAAQTSLQVTSHNIANANTEGYSRQSTHQITNTPTFTGGGYLGNGARVDAVERSYNQFLNDELRLAGQNRSGTQAYLREAEVIGDRLASDNTGLTGSLTSFFSSVSQAAEDPSSQTARTLVLRRAEAFASHANALQQHMGRQYSTLQQNMAGKLEEANQYVSSIQQLNDAIAASNTTGRQPNDLLDQRDLALRGLSELVPVTVQEVSDGSVNITLGKGQPLLVGSQRQILSIQPNNGNGNLPAGSDIILTPENEVGNTGAGRVVIKPILGGEVGGMMLAQDEVLLPSLEKLNTMLTSFAESVNQVQAQGVDAEGNPGQALFTVDQSGTTAFTGQPMLQVALSDPNQLAFADGGASGGDQTGDNRNALAMLALETDKIMGQGAGAQTLGQFYSQAIENAGALTAGKQSELAANEAIYVQAFNSRESVSGVNINEEAADIMRHQQAYSASAQVISVARELFDRILQL